MSRVQNSGRDHRIACESDQSVVDLSVWRNSATPQTRVTPIEGVVDSSAGSAEHDMTPNPASDIRVTRRLDKLSVDESQAAGIPELNEVHFTLITSGKIV